MANKSCGSALSDCYSPGIGPNCTPSAETSTQIKDLQPDGRNVIPGGTGAREKRECLDDLKRQRDEFMPKCICQCTDDITKGGGQYEQGTDIYCVGKCQVEAADKFDISKCYCNETKCGKSSPPPTDSTSPTTSGPDTPPTKPGDSGVTTYEHASFGPIISSVQTQSTYDAFIPRVFTRGVLQGNVIYVGNPRRVLHDVVTEKLSGRNVVVTTTTVVQTFVDFAIALCEGPIVGVSKVKVNDVLIYNNGLATDSTGKVVPSSNGNVVINTSNFSFFTKDKPIDNRYLDTITAFEVFTGDEDQVYQPFMQSEQGVATPGYRGLAYLYVSNFELTNFNGTVPHMEIEVIEKSGVDQPYQSVLTSSPANTFVADAVQRRVYVGDEVFDYDTLNTLSPADFNLPQDNASRLVSPDGYTVSYDVGHTRLFVVDNTTGAVSTTFVPSFDIDLPKSCFGAPRTTDSNTLPMLFAASDTQVTPMRIGAFGQSVTQYPSRNAVPVGDKLFKTLYLGSTPITLTDPKTGATSIVNYTLLAVVSSTALSLTDITISLYSLYDSKNVLSFDPSTLMYLFATYTIPSSVWGGKGSVKLREAFADPSDNGIVLIGTNFAAKVAVENGSIVWSTSAVAAMAAPANGRAATPTTITDYVYVGEDSKLYALNLLSGYLNQVPDITIPDAATGTRQFYDGESSSVIYVTADGDIRRQFIGRVAAQPTPLGDVIVTLCREAGLSPDLVDVTGLAGLSTSGYFIQQQSYCRDVLSQLSIIYNFIALEADYKIKFVALPTPGEYGIKSTDATSFERKSLVSDGGNDVVEFKYYDSTKGLVAAVQTTRDVLSPIKSSNLVAYSYPVVTDAAFAKAVSERLYANAILLNETTTINLPTAFISLEPGDYVDVTDIDGVHTTFRISTQTIGADLTIQLDLHSEARGLYTGDVVTLGVDTLDDLTGGLDPFTGVAVAKPRIILCNSIIDAHVSPKTQSRITGVYVGAALDTGATIAVNGEARVTTTKPLQIGALVSGLQYTRTDEFTLEDEASFVVKFTRADFVSQLNPSVALQDLLDDTTLNTIIVGEEIVQFQTYTLAGDGLTATFRGLLRGRRGSEYAMYGQRPGTYAYIYNKDSVGLATYGASDYHEPVSALIIGKTGVTTAINYHNMLAYYAPAVFRAKQNLGSGDIDFTFFQRTRVEADGNSLDADALDLSDAVTFYASIFILSEPFELERFKREVGYLDSRGRSTYIVREIKPAVIPSIDFSSVPRRRLTPTINYPRSLQVADGVTGLDSLYAVVTQNADANGFLLRGHPTPYGR